MALHTGQTDEQRTDEGQERQPDEPMLGDEQHAGEFQRQAERLQQQAQGQVEQAAQRVARERYPRRRITKRGTALLVGYVIALAALIALALAVHVFGILPGNVGFTLELQESHNPIVFALMNAISLFGYFPWSVIVVVVVLALVWLVRLRLEAIFLAITLLADALDGIIKLVVNSRRPSPTLVHVVTPLSSPGFPSGHTVFYTTFFGFILFLLLANFRSSWARNLLVTLLALLIILIGFSRVYLGEHWLSDVVGGYLLGALCLIPIIYGYLWARRRYGERFDRRHLFPLRQTHHQRQAA